MARGDGTGPAGMGPMTGRAAGYCTGYPTPGYMNPYVDQLGVGNRFGYPAARMGGQYAVPYSAWGAFAPYAGMYRPRDRFMGLPYAIPPWGMQYSPYEVPYSKEQEKEVLQGQVKSMEDQIAVIRKRIEELETEASKSTK